MASDETITAPSDPPAGVTLDAVPMSASSGAPVPVQQPIHAPTIKGYRIIRLLGEGGMGTVWRAWQIATRREVALKVMRLEYFGSERNQQRFEREVELTCRLQHTNICRIYDSGIHEGVYFYAMELIEGVSLDEYVRAHALPTRKILQIMRDIAGAVQHAHQLNVIHRDLKPSNIIVDAKGVPHLVDFGLAKDFITATASPSISMVGEVAGTPEYMSPEQAAGLDLVDVRTDVYTLGVILYRLLVGKSPHDLSGGRNAVMRRIIEDEPTHPRQGIPKLPTDLAAILLKVLSRDPGTRYRTAAEFAEDIDKYLREEPISAREPTLAYYVRRKIWKYRTQCAFLAAAILVIGILGIYALLRMQGERDAKRTLDDEGKRRTQEREEAQKQSDLQKAGFLVSSGSALMQDKKYRDAEAAFRDAFRLYHKYDLTGFPAVFAMSELCMQSPVLLRTFPAQAKIEALGYSSLRREFVSIDHSGSISRWSAFSKDTSSVVANVNGLLAAAIDSEAKSSAIISSDSTQTPKLRVQIWNLDGNSPPTLLPLDRPPVISAVISPSMLAFVLISKPTQPGQTGSNIQCYDLAEGKPLGPEIQCKQASPKAAFVAGDTAIALGGGEGIVEVFSISDGTSIVKIQCGKPIRDLHAGPDNSILIALNDGDIATAPIAPGAKPRTLDTCPDQTSKIAVRGSRVAVGAGHGDVTVFDMNDSKAGRRFEVGDEDVTAVFLDTSDLLMAGGSTSLSITDLSTTRPKQILSAPLANAITAMTLAPSGAVFGLGTAGGQVIIGDTATGQTLLDLGAVHKTRVCRIALAKDLQAIYSADVTGNIHVTPLAATGVGTTKKTSPASPLNCGLRYLSGTTFAEDCSAVFCWGGDGACDLNLTTGIATKLGDSLFPVCGASYAHRDSMKVLADNNRRFHIWTEPPGGTPSKRVIPTGTMQVACFAVTPDGASALCGDNQGTVQFIDLQSGHRRWTGASHSKSILHCLLAPDGMTGVTTSDDGSLRLWDLDSGKELCQTTLFGAVTALAMDPNGCVLMGCGQQAKTAFIVDLASIRRRMATPGPMFGGLAGRQSDDSFSLKDLMRRLAAAGRSDWAASAAINFAPANLDERIARARTLWQCGQRAERDEAAAEFQRAYHDPNCPRGFTKAYLGLWVNLTSGGGSPKQGN